MWSKGYCHLLLFPEVVHFFFYTERLDLGVYKVYYWFLVKQASS